MIFVEIFQSLRGGQQKHATHPTFLTEMIFVEIFQSLRGGQQKHATHPTKNVN